MGIRSIRSAKQAFCSWRSCSWSRRPLRGCQVLIFMLVAGSGVRCLRAVSREGLCGRLRIYFSSEGTNRGDKRVMAVRLTLREVSASRVTG
jgi:hypothetical protein